MNFDLRVYLWSYHHKQDSKQSPKILSKPCISIFCKYPFTFYPYAIIDLYSVHRIVCIF